MRIQLEPSEAEAAARCLLAMQAIQAQAQSQMARVQAKLAELEKQIRDRLPGLPPASISVWQWDLDPIEGRGSAIIPEDA